VNRSTGNVLAAHAAELVSLAELYAAIGASDAFARVAASWPYQGEIPLSPEDVVLSVRRFNEQVSRASRRAREMAGSTSGGIET
jgi:hypothetical protein